MSFESGNMSAARFAFVLVASFAGISLSNVLPELADHQQISGPTTNIALDTLNGQFAGWGPLARLGAL